MKTFLTKFFTKLIDFVYDNFRFMATTGYVIIVLAASAACVNAFLLPVPVWEWVVDMHWLPKSIFGIVFMPFILCAAARTVELYPKAE